MDKKHKKKYAILDILSNSNEPLSSIAITTILNAQGTDISERTVRLYLKDFDAAGFTVNIAHKGRVVTEAGRNETITSRVHERIGYLSGKIDAMTYRMTFDPSRQRGTIIVNLSLIPLHEFTMNRRKLFAAVFAQKFAMGKKMALFPPGSLCLGTLIPEKYVGVGTICSITFNGILCKQGIPVFSRFGGLLEIRENKPVRFVQLTNYDGTSIDPLALFMRAGMTNYLGVIKDGNGIIGASLREFPGDSVTAVRNAAEQLTELGLGNVICIGNPGQSIFDFQLSPERAGAIVVGGLNPISIFVETGFQVNSTTLAGAIPSEDLFPYTELDERLNRLIKTHSYP